MEVLGITGRSYEMLGLAVHVWHSNMRWSGGVHTQEIKLLFSRRKAWSSLFTIQICGSWKFILRKSSYSESLPKFAKRYASSFSFSIQICGGGSPHAENRATPNCHPHLRDVRCCRSHTTSHSLGWKSTCGKSSCSELSTGFASHRELSLTYDVQFFGGQKSTHRQSKYSESLAEVAKHWASPFRFGI